MLKAEVVTLALSKGEVEESVSSRCICARILGAAAKGLVSRWGAVRRLGGCG